MVPSYDCGRLTTQKDVNLTLRFKVLYILKSVEITHVIVIGLDLIGNVRSHLLGAVDTTKISDPQSTMGSKFFHAGSSHEKHILTKFVFAFFIHKWPDNL